MWTSSGVSLASFNGRLYMAWKGNATGNVPFDERIWWTTFDGTAWAPQQVVPNVWTSVGPRLAVFEGRLYLAWKGEYTDQRIWWTSFDGTSWAPQQRIPGVSTSVGPALAVFNGLLYAAWKGMEGDQGIWWSSFNGTSWAPQQQIPGVSSTGGPSLALFNGQLYAAWKGMYGDQRIWWSSFDGTSWAPQQQITRGLHQRRPGSGRVQQRPVRVLEGNARRPAHLVVQLQRHELGAPADRSRVDKSRPVITRRGSET